MGARSLVTYEDAMARLPKGWRATCDGGPATLPSGNYAWWVEAKLRGDVYRPDRFAWFLISVDSCEEYETRF